MKFDVVVGNPPYQEESQGTSKRDEPIYHFALMLDLRTDFSLPCKLIAEEHFLYDSIFTRI